MVSRRFFLAGVTASLIAAPAIVRASSLMKILPIWNYLSADEVAARIVARMDAYDESPEGRARLIWGANPGTQYCRIGARVPPPMPKEFVDIVQGRIAHGVALSRQLRFP